MIWDDAGFQNAYRERLRLVHASGDGEVRSQAMAFQAETARAGGPNGENFTNRAGAAAAIVLSGYVRGAVEAFDQTLAEVEAELVEADVNALRLSIEQDIARRAKSLPAALRDFTKPGAPPALLRAILEQAPVRARQLLAEQVSAVRERVRSRVQAREVPDRAVILGHDVRDATLADALRVAIQEAIGDHVALCTSSDRRVTQLKRNRITLLVVTPHSMDDPWLWWMLGVAEGAGKPAFALRTAGVGRDVVLPLRPEQVIDPARREDVVRLLRAIQAELRRRRKEVSELDLEDLLREAAHQGPSSARTLAVAGPSLQGV